MCNILMGEIIAKIGTGTLVAHPYKEFKAMQPSELEIRREVEALRDIKRRSTAQGGPGALAIDPDLPELLPSPSSSPISPGGGSQERDATDDPSHLFWVPASVHPEIAPKEFRDFLQTHARDGGTSLLRANSTLTSSTISPLGRRKSMLSRQYKPSETDGVEQERIVIRRNSSTRSRASQLTISDLQKLDELADEMSKSDDPTKIRSMLRRSFSLSMSPSGLDQMDDTSDLDDADSPIIVPPPNQILRRAQRTKIRKPGLQGDGDGHRFPSTRRGKPRSQTIATTDGSDQAFEEPYDRPQAPTPELSDSHHDERPWSYTDESLIFESYVDRRDSLTSSESHEPSEESVRENIFSTSSPLLQPSVEQYQEHSHPSTSPPPTLHQPIPQRHAPIPGTSDIIPSRSPSPSYSDSGSTTEIGIPLLTGPPEVHQPIPESSVTQSPQRPPPQATSPPPPSRREKEKKGLFGKWGSKDDKKKSKGDGSRDKEGKERGKDGDSGFFGSLFGKKKQEDSNSTSGLLHGSSGPATAAALLGASKSSRAYVPSPSPQLAGSYARYPIHVERAVYRLSHIKLANARRPLLEQVLISNLMFCGNATNGAAAQGQSQGYEQQQQQQPGGEAQERERGEGEHQEAERERQREREQMEQIRRESGRKGSLTRAPKPGGEIAASRRAEMPIRGPQYESQHRAMEEEYGYGGDSMGYGYPSMPNQSPPTSPPIRTGSSPPPPMLNSPIYQQYSNQRMSPQQMAQSKAGSSTNMHQIHQPGPTQAGPYYYNPTELNGHNQQSPYALPPGAMLPMSHSMDLSWLNASGSGSPPPNSSTSGSHNAYSYSPPRSPSPKSQQQPQVQQHQQAPPRQPRSPPPNHLANPGHPKHSTASASGRLPGRSLSATAVVPPASQSGDEDMPLAVWQQQQRASGRR
ncbi:hypothetical protein BU17DRAFT_77198 [Hysterangium stoloniferum]|nr:hypothetical protein BU17DRAFT_77198 [Hysterangium stoloniferum]